KDEPCEALRLRHLRGFLRNDNREQGDPEGTPDPKAGQDRCAHHDDLGYPGQGGLYFPPREDVCGCSWSNPRGGSDPEGDASKSRTILDPAPLQGCGQGPAGPGMQQGGQG